MLTKSATDNIELDLFLEALLQFHGYDLKNYARTSLMRRVEGLVCKKRLDCISALIPLLAKNEDFRYEAINYLTVNVSSLFRDPEVYYSLKKAIFPYLASFPRLTIWVAGCAEGLEAYSLAILLEEEKLLDRATIFATDISSESLKQAASGVLKEPLNAQDGVRYNQSSGEASLSDYFVTAYGKQKLRQDLLSKITFEHHDLVQQPAFLSAQLILCRNVMIYFDRELKTRVTNVLWESLYDNGHLVTGTKENIDNLDLEHEYTTISNQSKIYKKQKRY